MKHLKPKNISVKNTISFLLPVLYALTFVFSADVKSGVTDALSMCAKIIIPSVFPVMTLSNLMLLYGMPKLILRIAAVPSKLIFGLTGKSAECLLFGLTGGYPVTVKNARLMYERNMISENEAKRLCLCAVCPGLSFTVTVCGSFFASAKIGLSLFLSSLASCVTLGLIFRLADGIIPATKKIKTRTATFSASFISAVEKSTSAVISVCSYILVFSSVSALFRAVLPQKAGELLSPISEVTAGVRFASSKGNICFAAFLCGFGGVCVILQLLPDIKATGVNVGSFISCRIFTGVCASIYEYIFVKIQNPVLPAVKICETELYSNSFSSAALLFGMALMLIVSCCENNRPRTKTPI